MKFFAIISIILALAAGCSKQNERVENQKNNSEIKTGFSTVTASGYGESKEVAIEDAKNDALRQFGFDLVSKEGKPELIYAGKIVDFKVVSDYSEQVLNGTWWEIKIQAEIQKL
ncbi:MAG TPA: hypothetical protein PKW56_08110 [Clostridiales bacterium]|nr:hypothetical protein [Clostridiales bacterium]